MEDNTVKAGEFEAFDSLAENLGEVVVGPLFEVGQIISKTKEMSTLPGLPEGFTWRCIRNATGRSNSRWKVVSVEETP